MILKSYLRGMSIIFIRVIVCCSEVSFVCHVTCCIVMFCCFPLLTVGDILLAVFFYCEDLFLHWSGSFTGVNCLSHPILINSLFYCRLTWLYVFN